MVIIIMMRRKCCGDDDGEGGDFVIFSVLIVAYSGNGVDIDVGGSLTVLMITSVISNLTKS